MHDRDHNSLADRDPCPNHNEYHTAYYGHDADDGYYAHRVCARCDWSWHESVRLDPETNHIHDPMPDNSTRPDDYYTDDPDPDDHPPTPTKSTYVVAALVFIMFANIGVATATILGEVRPVYAVAVCIPSIALGLWGYLRHR